MSEIKAIFPERIYCTQQIDKETKDKRHIYNDFSIIIEITGCTQAKKRGDNASIIHIYGLEKLFLTDGQKSIDKTMAQFAALLQAVDNPQWNVSYNTNSKSIDITCTTRKLDKYSIVKFQLSEQCEFTANLSNNNHVDLSVTSENFNLFCPDLDESKPHNYTIWAQQVAYIDKFAAFEYNPQEQNKKNEPQEVKAIHKGDWASIQWDLGNLDHYTASLLDENGERKTNVSPYIVQIDKDRKFTLKVKKDNTIVTQSLNVYRTLWEKVAEGQCPEGFTPDPKGNNKFFYKRDGYYFYIHPYIWYSEDLINWSIKSSMNTEAPNNFDSYYCNYSETYDEAIICFTSKEKITIVEYHFRDKTWFRYNFIEKNDKNNGWTFCQAIKRHSKTILFTANQWEIDIYNVIQNNDDYYLEANPFATYFSPEGSEIISMDLLHIDSKSSEIYFALICNNKRIYVYDIDNEYRNNLFEIKENNQKNIFLIKTNSTYVVLNNYVFELNDREKFTDIHFSPQISNKDINNQEILIVGKRNEYTFSAIIQKQKELSVWNYKF